jgi:hypothetical protein
MLLYWVTFINIFFHIQDICVDVGIFLITFLLSKFIYNT